MACEKECVWYIVTKYYGLCCDQNGSCLQRKGPWHPVPVKKKLQIGLGAYPSGALKVLDVPPVDINTLIQFDSDLW